MNYKKWVAKYSQHDSRRYLKSNPPFYNDKYNFMYCTKNWYFRVDNIMRDIYRDIKYEHDNTHHDGYNGFARGMHSQENAIIYNRNRRYNDSKIYNAVVVSTAETKELYPKYANIVDRFIYLQYYVKPEPNDKEICKKLNIDIRTLGKLRFYFLRSVAYELGMHKTTIGRSKYRRSLSTGSKKSEIVYFKV